MKCQLIRDANQYMEGVSQGLSCGAIVGIADSLHNSQNHDAKITSTCYNIRVISDMAVSITLGDLTQPQQWTEIVTNATFKGKLK
jgi:hypothetical protein